MNKISFHILRIGLAVTFLWIGVLILRNPEAWGEYMRPWAAGLLPVPVTQVMIGTAILDIIIGVFLLINLNKKNMKKAIVAIIIIAIVVLGGYYLFKKTPEQAVQESTSQPFAEQTQTEKTNVITYTEAGYSPSALEIKAGETVTFKNESQQSMWPASAIHPTHKDYPTTGGCLGSAFDACQDVQPSDIWSFKFDIAGNWKYHDHLSPKNFGAISVK